MVLVEGSAGGSTSETGSGSNVCGTTTTLSKRKSKTTRMTARIGTAIKAPQMPAICPPAMTARKTNSGETRIAFPAREGR